MSLLAIHAGAAYQLESIEGPRFRGYFDAAIRPEQLPETDLDRFDALIVICRTPAFRMVPHVDRLWRYLDGGGTIAAMGECHSQLWLPGVRFTPEPTNWWWWLDPNGDLGVSIAKPDHPLFARLTLSDITWHLHGFLDPPPGTEVLAVGPGEQAILYVDEVTTRGRMIVTSLDPFFHHGHHFMPATTRFLDGFLPWLTETAGTPARP